LGAALRPPPPDVETPATAALPRPGVRTFGDYELLEEIARGGMGVVHKARQISLNRIVAVKMILGGGLAGQAQVQRFRAEAQAAAELRHPSIVAIHEVGEHQGQLYFSMDYIEGKNLAEVISNLRFEISNYTRSVSWVKTIAEAVHSAHRHGILHRDLKPANIIIDPDDQPHITDFGLAKRFFVPPRGDQGSGPSVTTANAGADRAQAGTTNEAAGTVTPADWLDNSELSTLNSQLTVSGQVLGSPSYLSPEQAEGKRGTVGVPSDVYSLGAVFYHLLTGRPPFQGETLTALLRQVIETEPVAPRLLNPSVPRDLETICLKCLEKEQNRRYPSARELADELSRFLANEPIRARPVHRAERAWRWCWRNPKLAAALGAVVMSLALGLVTTTWQMRRAQASELVSRQHAYAADMDLAGRALAEEDIGRVQELLNRYAPPTKSSVATGQRPSTINPRPSTDLRGWEWVYLWQKSRSQAAFRLCARPRQIGGLAFTADGRRLIVQEHIGEVVVYDLETRQPVPGLVQPSMGVRMGYSPTNDLVAFPWNVVNRSGAEDWEVRVWDLRRNTIVSRLRNEGGYTTSLAFSPDGRWLAGFGPAGGSVWDLATGNLITNLFSRGGPLTDQSGVVVFSPAGDQLAVGDYDGSVRLHALPSGDLEADLPFVDNGVFGLAFAPNGRWLVASSSLSSNVWARVWELPSRRAMELPGLRHPPGGLAFDPSGALLAAGDGHLIRIWDLAQRRLLASLPGHRSLVSRLAFAPNGRCLASGSFLTPSGEGEVLLWEFDPVRTPSASEPRSLTTGRARGVFPPDWRSIVFAPDSKSFLALTNGCVTRFDTITLTPIAPLPQYGTNNTSFAVAADGQSLATTDQDGVVHFWDVATQRESGSFRPYPEQRAVYGLRVLGKGGLVTTVNDAGGLPLHIWDTATWQQTEPWRSANEGRVDESIVDAESSRDGRLLATLVKGGIALWEMTTPPRLAQVGGVGARCLAFSPDGRWLAFGVSPVTIKLCEVPTLEVVGTLGAPMPVNGLAFSPDGRRLASTGVGPQAAVTLWDMATQRRLIDLTSVAGIYCSPQFSPDGQTLTAMCCGETYFWRVPALENIDKGE